MDGEIISEDTQVVLLLCGVLGGKTMAKPLTPAQYNGLVTGLVKLGRHPGDLLHDDALAASACAAQEVNNRLKEPATSERVKALLSRGVALSLALDKWGSYGIVPVGRGDARYPKRFKEHFNVRNTPAVIYCAGNMDLLLGGGMAFVGSRDLTEESAEAIRKVVRDCVAQGLPIVSGGARGADQMSMRVAYENGGSVIGALSGDLCRTCLEPASREALARGNALLFSAADPEAGFSSYAAMDRNKFIYAMADACFVAQSGVSVKGMQSGTYEGAVEELKRADHRPVFVYLPAKPSAGCIELVKNGAAAWDMDKSVAENLAGYRQTLQKSVDSVDLFSSSSAAEPVKAYGVGNGVENGVVVEETKIQSEALSTPYGLVKEWLGWFLQVPRDEKEVKKRVAKAFDLLTAQVKYWLEKLEKEGVFSRKEYPKGKKGKVVMCERCVK